MRQRSRWRATLAALGVGVLLVACTDGPTPPDDDEPEEESAEDAVPGSRREVVVLLPPATDLDPATLEAMRTQIDATAPLLRGVDDVRAVVPDDEVFVGDLLRSFAERRPDVLCVVEPEDEARLRGLAVRYPDVGICVLGPDAPDVDEDDEGGDIELRRTVMQTEEIGFVVGAVVRERAGLDATVGIVLTEGWPAAASFRAGLLAGIGDLVVIEAETAGAADVRPADQLEAVIDAGATHVVIDAGPGAVEAIEMLDGRARVYAPREVLAAAGVVDDDGNGTGAPIGIWWERRWAPPLGGPVGALGDEGRRERTLGALGLARFSTSLGGGDPLDGLVRSLRRSFARGERDAFEPQVRPRPEPPDADGDDEAAADPDDATASTDADGAADEGGDGT